MKKMITLVFGLWAVVAVSGCMGEVKTTQHVEFPRTGKQFKNIDNPNMARIYVARPTRLEHNRLFTVKDGGTHIADLGPYGYACWERRPGKTTILTYNIQGDYHEVDLDVERGRIYYFQMYCWPNSNNNIREQEKYDGIRILKECSPPDFF